MSTDRKADALLEEIVAGRLNRRSLLKRAAVIGLSTPVMASLLAACGGDEDEDEPTAADTEATTAPSGGTTPEAGDEETPEADADETVETEDEETPEADGGETPDAEADPTEEDSEGEDSGQTGDGVYGGRMVIATISQPADLDMHQLGGGRGKNLVGWHFYETLFTWDNQYVVTPQLAESYEASDDSLTHTITLRQGVPFHNGEEMTAADVVASLERWGELAQSGALIMDSLESMTAVDDYTVEIVLSSPTGVVQQILARGGQGAAIMPASVVEAVGTDIIDEHIGTGPYRFVEMETDRYTLLERFEDYVGPDGPSSGYAGTRNAYFDELEFIPVPDEAARVAGFQAGDYHYLEEVVADQIQQMQDDPNLVVQILPPRSYGYIGLNHDNGPMSDLVMRKAVQAALSFEEHGLASHGEGFFEVTGPHLMLPITIWGESDAGEELYNIGDTELAAQYLEEAGYDGTPIRWLTTQDDLGDYNSAVVAQQQLEAAGFTIELTVLDEATLASTTNEREGWDIRNSAQILRTDPTLYQFLSSPDYSGYWTSPEKEAAFQTLLQEIDFDTRYEAFEELQRLFYEQVGGIKQQDNFGIMTVAAIVKNFGPETTLFELEPEFTNAWFE